MRETGAEVTERNYAKMPLTGDEVRAIVEIAGVPAVLNTRHELAKANGWKERPPSADAFVAAVVAEPNLLRRPILVRGRRVVVGKDEAAIRDLLADAEGGG